MNCVLFVTFNLTLLVSPFCMYSTPIALVPSNRMRVVRQRTSAFKLGRDSTGRR